ncbi:hypothetical protein [Spirochaeta dissipatitropha]
MKKGLTIFAILLLAFGLVLAGCDTTGATTDPVNGGSSDTVDETTEPEVVLSHDFSTFELGTEFEMVGSGSAVIVDDPNNAGTNVLKITVENYHTGVRIPFKLTDTLADYSSIVLSATFESGDLSGKWLHVSLHDGDAANYIDQDVGGSWAEIPVVAADFADWSGDHDITAYLDADKGSLDDFTGITGDFDLVFGMHQSDSVWYIKTIEIVK